MIELREKFAEKDKRTLAKIDEVYNFSNKQAPYVIYEPNYWLFGEVPQNIPDGYCSDDPSIMMDYQLKKIKAHYENPLYNEDAYYGFLMPWFGTGVLASGFGTKVEFLKKMDPAVAMSEIRKPEEIDELVVPDGTKDGIMPMVLKNIEYFRTHCDLPIGVTDCQGPLTTALSVIGYENFIYWAYDYPEKIHLLMQKCTDALIAWIKLQKECIGVPYDEAAYCIGIRMQQGKGAVWIADDDSVIMPADLFAEFVKPYNEQIMTAFEGGGCIHYCGCSNQNIQNYMNTKGLNGLHNFHLDDFDRVKEVRNACLENGKVFHLCDFVPADARLDDYYTTVFRDIEQKGMIVVSYIAPAIALINKKYEAVERKQEEMAERVRNIIEEKRKIYY